MARLFVRSFPAPQFNGVFKFGHQWMGAGEEVELVEGMKDPELKEGEVFTIPQPSSGEVLKLSPSTIDALRADARFAVTVVGPIEDVGKLKARIAELEGLLAAATAPAPKAKPKDEK